MIYFRYNEKTSKNILNNIALIVCHIDDNYSSTAPIYSREIIKTDFTTFQDVRSYINSKYADSLTFKFSLVKSDYSEFTLYEINKISDWLFGNNISQKLEIFSDEFEENSFFYRGMFTNIEKQRAIGTIALTCTFENDSSFLYSEACKTITTQDDTKTASIIINNVMCQLPLYPKIKFTTTSTAGEFNSVTIMNNTNSTHMNLQKILDGVEYNIDTKNSIITNSYGVCSFSDIGWNGISDISWMYLNKGLNIIHVTVKNGICNLAIEYENKILGGVINEFSI